MYINDLNIDFLKYISQYRPLNLITIYINNLK